MTNAANAIPIFIYNKNKENIFYMVAKARWADRLMNVRSIYIYIYIYIYIIKCERKIYWNKKRSLDTLNCMHSFMPYVYFSTKILT